MDCVMGKGFWWILSSCCVDVDSWQPRDILFFITHCGAEIPRTVLYNESYSLLEINCSFLCSDFLEKMQLYDFILLE